MSTRLRARAAWRIAPLIAGWLFALLLGAGASARADAPEPSPGSGSLDAVGPDGEPLGACPLEHTDVSVEIAGSVARVVVTQVFSNPFPDPIEAVYTFPLSERAAVDAMWMRTGEREIRGEIKRRTEARRIYEQARQQGRLASLLDQERPNIFTQSLANLMPGARVEIELHYVEPLRYEAGSFEFAFPTVVGPRFIPGAPTGRQGTGWAPDTNRVPDASRITPPVTPKGTRAGHDIRIALDVEAGVPILDVESPLHEVDVERPSATRVRVRLREEAEIPNRDFVLRYAVAADEVRSGYLVHRSKDGDGYVTFVLVPPKRVTPRTAAPKEMIFVIDRSGSQSGLPLLKAKETMLWILDHMNPHDTFQVVDFGSTTNMLFDAPQPASLAMKARARAYIQALRANGGTMMAEAVQRVSEVPAADNRLRIVTFMTDGYIGNDFEVIDLVRRVRGTSRWFPFGTGNSTNRFLLDNIAREGGGEVDYVLLNAPGDEVAKRFYQRIASPVLTDVRLEFEGLDVVDVYPRRVSDVWAQRPLIVHARYRKAGKGRVILHGFRRGEPYREALEVVLPERAEANDALASMWARAKVDELMRRDLRGLQSGSFPEELEEKIVEVALAHRIMTQFTSFVAVEEKVVNENGTLRRVAVPVEMPQGVTYAGVFGHSGTVADGRLRFAAKTVPRASVVGVFRALEAAGRASRAPVAAEPEARGPVSQRRYDALSKAARSRLAPELLALLKGQAAPATLDLHDGKVTVKVTVSRISEARVRRLEALGFDVHQLAEGFLVGSIDVEALLDLAELAFVGRIEPA